MSAQPTEARATPTSGSTSARAAERDSNEPPVRETPATRPDGTRWWLSAGRSVSPALTLVGVGLALVAAGIFVFDSDRMVDLTDEGIHLMQARPHDANEILPSPFGRVTTPIFWLVRHELGPFRVAGLLIVAIVTAVLILLLVKSRTRGRVALAITGGIAAAVLSNAEYLRTPNYNWLTGAAVGVVAIGLVILIAPSDRVVNWPAWRQDLIGGVIFGFGIALTLTARVHSAAVATVVVALALGVWLWLLTRRGEVRGALARAARITAAFISTCSAWVTFALVLPAGGGSQFRRDVENGLDWLDAVESTSTRGLGRYPEDLREFLGAVGGALREQAPGAAGGLLLGILVLAVIIASGRRRSHRLEPLTAPDTAVVPLMIGAALGGALLMSLARGDLHAGHDLTEDLGPDVVGLAIWAVIGRFIGVASLAFLARRPNWRPNGESSAPIDVANREASGRPVQLGWIVLTAALGGLILAVTVGSGNPMAYQLHFGSVLLVATLVVVVARWKGNRNPVARRPRRELAQGFLAAMLCLVFGLVALRWVLDARERPYRQYPLTMATKTFRSTATGVSVDLPESQGRGLERLEREARRAGWRPGTSLLDITPFHPIVTFWLGADPPFSIYPAVQSPHATNSLMLTIDREEHDDLRGAWLLVSAPLLPDVDYSAIARRLGHPWPCGYEAVASANLGRDFVSPGRDMHFDLLRPVPGPVPSSCPDTAPAPT